MTARVAERFIWAVEVLDPQPANRLLEIGCGQGVAVSLICKTLSGGSIVAIDRSQAMIDRAKRRNREYVDDGTARFQTVALKDADFGDARFDKVFAVNVRLFAADAEDVASALRRALEPSGALYLVQQHPSAGRTSAATEELKVGLRRNGFSIREERSKGADASSLTCIVAGGWS